MRTDPSGTSSSTPTARTRDRSVDVARLASLVMVMFGHCALLLATIDATGLRVGNLLGALPQLAPLTWIAQVMPLFFLAGGAAGAYGWRAGTPWGTWLFTRAQRLCRPVFWYLGAWLAILLAARPLLGANSAERLGREGVALLWFLGIYLVALAFVPVLVRLRSGRAMAGLLVALIVATIAIDAVRFTVDDPMAGVANFVIVWLIPVVIGVGYARGLLSTPVAWATTGVTFGAQLLLAAVGPYPVALVVTGTREMSNIAPPTLVLALHCLWMSTLFVALSGPIRRWSARPRIARVVTAGNRGAMTLYLWHVPVIAVAALALHTLGLDAYDVHAPGFIGLLALRAVVFGVLMFGAFWLLTPLEHRPLPVWDRPVRAAGWRSGVAGALVCAAGVSLLLLAKNGLGDSTGLAWLGCFLAALTVARLSIGVRPGRASGQLPSPTTG